MHHHVCEGEDDKVAVRLRQLETLCKAAAEAHHLPAVQGYHTEYGAYIEAGFSTVEVCSNRIHSHTDGVTEAGLLVKRVAQPGVALLEVMNNTVYGNSQAAGIGYLGDARRRRGR